MYYSIKQFYHKVSLAAVLELLLISHGLRAKLHTMHYIYNMFTIVQTYVV